MRTLLIAFATLVLPGVASAQAAFEMLDADRDGFVTAVELQAINGATPDLALALLRRKDGNGDGVLQAHEFASESRGAPAVLPGRIQVRGDLSKADADRDGKITLAELKSGVSAQHAPVMEAVFRQTDVNGDGFISKEEIPAP